MVGVSVFFFSGVEGSLSVSLPLGRDGAPRGGKVIVHHLAVALFFYTVPDGLEDYPQPPIHRFQVQFVQDGGDFVLQQGFFHQMAQLVLLLGQEL